MFQTYSLVSGTSGLGRWRPFEGKELSGSQYLENSIDASCSIKELVHCEDDLGVCRGIVDESDPEWKLKVREEVLFADKDVMESEVCVKRRALRKGKREHQKLYSMEKRYKPKKSFWNLQDLKAMRRFQWFFQRKQICCRNASTRSKPQKICRVLCIVAVLKNWDRLQTHLS